MGAGSAPGPIFPGPSWKQKTHFSRFKLNNPRKCSGEPETSLCLAPLFSSLFLQMLKSAFLVRLWGGGGYVLSPKNGGDLYEGLVVGIK